MQVPNDLKEIVEVGRIGFSTETMNTATINLQNLKINSSNFEVSNIKSFNIGGISLINKTTLMSTIESSSLTTLGILKECQID